MIEALAGSGFEPSRIVLSTKESTKAEEVSVQVVIRGAQDWKVPGTDLIWAYQPRDNSGVHWSLGSADKSVSNRLYGLPDHKTWTD